MGKLTWQQLANFFGGSGFNLTPDEAAKILTKTLLTNNWKTQRMWEDQDVVASWTQVLYEHDKLAKKYGKHKAVFHLFKSGAVKDFQYMAKIKWKSYKTFRNDFIKFNKLPMFKNTPSGHGTKLREAAEKKLAAKAKKEAQRHKLLTKLIK
tara:strand:+ start:72 stop:524 length:453 start_codon:yes stop_codon:yes gene_type:complete